MAIQLDHTIVPAHDKIKSAKFFARIFGLAFAGEVSSFEVESVKLFARISGLCLAGDVSHLAPVRVNDGLTMAFDNRPDFESHHYAFKVSEEEFDRIFRRLQEEGIAYGSGPCASTDMSISHRGGGRGVYFRDPNGHIFELLTA